MLSEGMMLCKCCHNIVSNKAQPKDCNQSKSNAPNRKQYKHEISLQAWIWNMFQWIIFYIHDNSPCINNKHNDSFKYIWLPHNLYINEKKNKLKKL